MTASRPADVLRGAELRAKLRMNKQRFYRKVRAGAFRHLEAIGPSSVLGYVVYSRKRVDDWMDSAAPVIRLARRA